MSATINANPVIRNDADLPTRSRHSDPSLSSASTSLSAFSSSLFPSLSEASSRFAAISGSYAADGPTAGSGGPLVNYLGGILWHLDRGSVGRYARDRCFGQPSGGQAVGKSSRSDEREKDPFLFFTVDTFHGLVQPDDAPPNKQTQQSDSAPHLDGVLPDSSEEIDAQEIYDLIAPISDPEHPLSLGSLAVVNLDDIYITGPAPGSGSSLSTVLVQITPTISHCSLATVIGLGVRVRLEQALPPRYRVDVHVKPGTHATGDAVTKQLTDKERVAAALENETLMRVIHKMLATCR